MTNMRLFVLKLSPAAAALSACSNVLHHNHDVSTTAGLYEEIRTRFPLIPLHTSSSQPVSGSENMWNKTQGCTDVIGTDFTGTDVTDWEQITSESNRVKAFHACHFHEVVHYNLKVSKSACEGCMDGFMDQTATVGCYNTLHKLAQIPLLHSVHLP